MKEFISFNIEELRRYFRICPAVLALLEYAAGYCAYNGLYYIAFPLIFLGIVASGKSIHRWLAPLLLGIGLCCLYENAPWDTYKKQLPRMECSASVRGRMGSHCGRERQRWKCEFHIEGISACKGGFRKCRGKVLAYFPYDVPYMYGAECTAEGSFLAFDDDFTRRYYKSKLLNHTFHAHLVREFRQGTGIFDRCYSWLFELRERLSERLVHGIDSSHEAAIYQAMIFGKREELSRETREAFMKSSTIHLFSISGLHIGLMSVCLGLFARVLPFRWRLPLVCLGLLGYVFLSGGAPSALRAWLMISLVIVSQIRWHVHSSENTLGAAGLALLAMNPFYLEHNGFLFSFTLVYVLLRSRKACRQAIDTVCEKMHWLPPNDAKRRIWQFYAFALATIMGSIVAWLGCNGLMMQWNGMVSYGSILVNALIGPAALLLVAGAIPKIALSFLLKDGFAILGASLCWLLKLLRFGAEAASVHGLFQTGCITTPAFCICYYALLWLALSSFKPRIVRYLALAALLFLVAFFPHRRQTRQFVIACSSENGGVSCIAFADAPHHAWLIQPGEWHAGNKVLQELKKIGHADHIDIIIQNHAQIPSAKAFMKQSRGRVIVMNADKPKMAAFKEYAAYKGWNVFCPVPALPVKIEQISPGREQISFKNNKYVLECSLRPSARILGP